MDVGAPRSQSSPKSLRPALSGLCALLVGVGLARFAYTPLLPALISGHWFSAGEAACLGAANLAGYLAGALAGHGMIRRFRPRWVVRSMMLLTAASLFACGRPEFGIAWFLLWRFLSGCTGGVIMVVATPTILVATPPRRRGLVGGTMFTGVGLGVAASGTLVPQLIEAGGIEGAWLGLGLIALALTLVAWSGWPDAPVLVDRPAAPARLKPDRAVAALLLEYALNAVGLVPHMLFLVDFIARGLGRGLRVGASYWVLFGIAAVIGPLAGGRIADRVGFRSALRLAFLIQAAAVAVPVVTSGATWLAVSSVIAGAFTPGISTLTLGRVHELAEGASAQRRVWAQATIAWALTQAIAASASSYLFGRFGAYTVLFSLGATALLIALGVDLASQPPRRRTSNKIEPFRPPS